MLIVVAQLFPFICFIVLLYEMKVLLFIHFPYMDGHLFAFFFFFFAFTNNNVMNILYMGPHLHV